MFSITDHKGFRITFSNGWAVSVQFGAGNYGDHYNDHDYDAPRKARHWDSCEAEVAIIHTNGLWYSYDEKIVVGGGATVLAYKSADQVAAVIAHVLTLNDSPVLPSSEEVPS